MSESIYLDHAATTPVRSEVLEAMLPFLGARFGNPSSVHRWGRDARVALDEARETIAHALGAHADEICFTSGGTEGDNFAILGAWRAARATRPVVVSTPIEHKAVLEAVHRVVHEGGDERLVPVTSDGLVEPLAFASAMDARVAVASVMWINNEVGVVQPVEALGEIARAHGALFHTDAVQALGKVAIDTASQPVDLLTLSGHKIGAPKGIGALYIRRGVQVDPLLHGGGQDRGRRPGTENVAFAVGLARAVTLAAAERRTHVDEWAALRDALEAAILDAVPDAVIHGRGAPRAPHIVNVSLPGTDSESMLMALDLRGIACSAGSACQSGSISVSHVLSAMGVSPTLAASALRLSLGSMNDAHTPSRVAEALGALVQKARAPRAAAMVEAW
ncbi:MAG: cysteine desulfurase [Gemmatimonadaceae bacterium]|jgi:cysteine desulfurase|nr:cysteine desulfurase [Gemmatimonadaceae bacterium]